MSRYSYTDIVIELCELCRDLGSEIRHHLNYYRASVYKQETSRIIIKKTEKLRVLAELLKDDVILEAFHDHDAIRELGGNAVLPGECSFSTRTARVLEAIDAQTEKLIFMANNRTLEELPKSFANSIHRRRRELLSMCRQGTRQWAFFQTL